MLLPQSSAFAALKNRLNSVSAIGYLHVPSRSYVSGHVRQKSTEAKFGASATPASSSTGFDRPNRLKTREESGVRWGELLDNFRNVQERARRANRPQAVKDKGENGIEGTQPQEKGAQVVTRDLSRPSSALSAADKHSATMQPPPAPVHKPKSSLGRLGRFAGNVADRSKGKK